MPSEQRTEVVVKNKPLDQRLLRISSPAKEPRDFGQPGSTQPHQPIDLRISRRRLYTMSDVFQEPGSPRGSVTLSSITAEREAPIQPQTIVSPSQVCLCQRDPKVPRPRNAFILYRQHHQGEVAKLNPGLANPDISKIIGEYWRQSSPEIKEKWRNLAEEEKARHHKQYPEYRYQPRRSGRGSLAATGSSDPDIGKCPKCGGRSMTAPRLASPPVHEASELVQPTAAVSRIQRPSPPYSASTPHGSFSQYLASPPLSRFNNRASNLTSVSGSVPYGSVSKIGALVSPLYGPEAKRRRYDSMAESSSGSRQASMIMASGNHTTNRRPSLTSLPRPEYLNKASGLAASCQGSASQAPPILAPIKVGSPSSQSKSVEAMIMSIAPLAKVRTLARVSNLLSMSGPPSSPHATRGSIIAVEGTDDEALKTVITHLRNRLQQDNEHLVKLFYGGNIATRAGSFTFAEWLKVIQSWHHDSEDIKKFIMSTPRASPVSSPASGISPKTVPPLSRDVNEDEMETDERAARMSKHTAMADGMKSADISVTSNNKRKASELDEDSPKHPIPVAIIPRYQLTLTDVAASLVPIADGYSPVDHWQWMAATWRGIPGPDVTIIVRAYAPDEMDVSNSAAPADSKTRPPEVDVKLAEYRTVILRYEKGAKIAESSLRRVVFEVEEWLRGMEERL